MKIAHLALPLSIPPKNYGGTEKIIYYLAKKQAENGHDVTVFAGPDSNIPGCHTECFVNNYSMNNSFFLQKLKGSQQVLKAYLKIGKDFDLIHNHVWEEGIALSFLAKVPVLTTLHGVAYTKFPRTLISKLFSLTRKTKLVSLSSQSLLQHKKFYGDDMLGFVHNCLTPSNLEFSKTPSKKHDIELCYLGLISPHKGPHKAVEVAEKLHHQGKDVRLKIGGRIIHSYEKYANQIRSLIQDKPYVEFLPNLPNEEISNLIGNSDAFLFPILWDEPFGIAMTESLYCGTPVIAFSRGSVSEIIENGKNGFICNTTDEMCDAILSINKIDREYCKKIVEKNFSIEAMYQKYMKFYELVINHKKDFRKI